MSNPDTGAHQQHLDHLTNLFRLLSDRTRLNILMLLSAGERNVSSLCDELQLPQPTVSHHLGLLRNSNMIGNRRSGKQVFYGLNGKMDAIHRDLFHIFTQSYELRIVARSAEPTALPAVMPTAAAV